MRSLLELDASRVPEAILRCPRRGRLLAGGPAPSLDFLERLLEGAFGMLGADAVLSPLDLPFRVIGIPDFRLSAAAILTTQPLSPSKDTVISAARTWRLSSESPHLRSTSVLWGDAPVQPDPDALDALWCLPGETWLGMASAESRARAMAGVDRPLLMNYVTRSLEASLLADLAELTGKTEPLNLPIMALRQAIVLEPSEMIAVVPGWPMHSWGVVVLDEEGGRARSEVCEGEENLPSALGGRAVWPPRSGMSSWIPSCEEEMRFVDALVAIAAIRPPRPPAAWGAPDDEVDW